MDTGSEDADEAVLDLLQRDEGLMMDDLIAKRPDFSWAQLFLAIDRLSRKHLIVLHRVGLSYQIFLMNQGCPPVRANNMKNRLLLIGDEPEICDLPLGFV